MKALVFGCGLSADEMAEALKMAKLNRRNKLRACMRKHKRLKALIDGGAENDFLVNGYVELSAAFKDVEKAPEDLY